MRFCIIGGRGQMGRLFEKVFISKGHDVIIQGRQRYNQLSSDIDRSDIIIVSVPINNAREVIKDISKSVSKDKLVIDFSSAMKNNLSVMKKLKCGSAFVHPLFGPNIDSLKNLNFVVAKINESEKLEWFIDFLKEEDANILESTVDSHDRAMSVIQAVTHFNNIVMADTYVDEMIELNNGFDTTLFSMNKKILSRLFSQKSHVSENIQFNNTYSFQALDKHKKNFEKWFNIIKDKNKLKFDIEYDRIASKLETSEDNVTIKVNNPHFDKESIAVLGPRGSHSDSVARLFSNQKKIYVDSISKIIEAVRTKKVKQGIIPIENSIHGTVVESLDGINNSNLYITKAIVTSIHHSCVALNNHAEIDSVISHPQALAQCSKYIDKKFPNARLIHALSTADALEKLKINQLTNAVAIGTKIGAELYGLKIIDEKIENTKQNKTKFVVISKKSKLEGNVSSISILPFHEKQGILFNLLKFLDNEKINLTKIESRPLRNQLGKYIFYLDIDGNINEKHIKQAISNIKKNVGIVKILGSYEVITNDR